MSHTPYNPWAASQDVQWTYKRPQGDIEVWAKTKSEAIQTIHQFGFTVIDPKDVVQTSAAYTMQDMLKLEPKPIE